LSVSTRWTGFLRRAAAFFATYGITSREWSSTAAWT
jgi:hypothetical protein